MNIASYLLADAYEGRYDTAVVLSNDSDLTTPIEMVTNRLGKAVIVINLYPAKRQSRELLNAATSALQTINLTVLRDSQFPDRLTDARGSFTRPRPWR